jgi:hypothetical protein
LAWNLPPDNISSSLLSVLKDAICCPEFISRHKNSAKDFIRNRILSFQTLLVFLLNLNKGACQDELDNFFKSRDSLDVAERVVTSGAFTKARKKLKHGAFVELNNRLTSFFYENYTPLNWKGFRLLAIDGSTVKTPKESAIAEHFGAWDCAKGDPCPIARVSGMYDVLNKLYVDALIRPKAQGERQLAAEHITKIAKGDLILLDRGYPAFWLFARIVERGADFCARISATKWIIVRKFLLSGLKEQIINLKPGRNEKSSTTASMRVRLVRVDIGNPEPEVLITSLIDTQAIVYDDFKELYHKRWGIEEAYKALKCCMEIENFSGKSVESVYQDFHSTILTANLASAIASETRDAIEETCKDRKHSYQLNFTQALSKMKNSIVLLFTRLNITGILKRLIELFAKSIEPIRPDRMFKRNKKVKLQKFFAGYKRVS